MKKTVLLVFVMGVLACSLHAQIPTKGLVAFYPFNGNTKEASGNNNNGSVVGGATLTVDRFGHPGQAYNLDGLDAYIAVPNSPSLNPDSGISVSGWWKAVHFTGGGYSPLVDKGYTAHVPPYYQYKLGVSGDLYPSLPGRFAFSVSINDIEYRIATDTNYWKVGEWYFLVGTYDGTGVKLYVNSQLIKTLSATGILSVYTSYLNMGDNTTADDFLQGGIDDIRIYKRALTQQEIDTLYKSTVAGINDFKDNTFNVIVYPNPCRGHLEISCESYRPDELISEVFDNTGRMIYRSRTDLEKGGNNKTIDLSSFPNGIYNVKINYGNNYIIKKVTLIN